MWLEIKALITSFSGIFIFIGLIFTNNLTVMSLMLTLMGLGMMIFGDIIIGYQITSNELKPQMDKTPPNKELMILKEIGGKVHFINTNKDKMGIRTFRWHRQDAGIINDGEGMGILPNGNRVFFAHESFDKNISMEICSALHDIKKATGAKEIKEIYDKLIKKLESMQQSRVTYG